MKRWISILTHVGTVVGAGVVILGLIRFFAQGLVAPLLIALSVIIVGPVEDILNAWVEKRVEDEETRDAWITLIDRTTSLAFLILLLFVVAA